MRRNVLKLSAMILSLSLLTSCEEPIPIPEACVLPVDEAAQLQENTTPDPLVPRDCIIPEKEDNANLTVNAHLRDFPIAKEEKMQDALKRLKIVINSKEFKDRVLNHNYNGQKIFVDNNGLTNKEVYDVIQEAAETLIPEVDHEIDVDITLYYTNNSTVGYTYPDTTRIWVNDKFFSTFTLGKVAANVVHEWTHKLGFNHDYNRTDRRNFSVPYGVGSIIEELVDKM